MLAPLTLNILAVFFFAGLMFRQALLTSVIMLLVFAATTAFGDLDPQLRIEGLLISTLACAFGGIVYRDVERSYRRSFLESGLLSELVARDALSGLMNRRAFDEHLLRVWQQAQRSQHSLAVIMVDIDHFKRYNDTFGHQAGDAALRKVAGVAQGFARRPLDLAARYGGEEFVLILYDLPLVHVLDIAERLRESVASLKLRADRPREETGPEVTVSLGVGFVVPGIGRTQHGAVKLADEALYEAKQTGRNRVCMNGPDAYLLLDTGAFHIGESARGR
jgi:diguanylate cyclase (GGDEF)-like protein